MKRAIDKISRLASHGYSPMKPVSLSLLLAGSFALTGCIGGTTYGTGKRHDAATLEGISNLFSLTPAQEEKIDYSARPDLVIPKDKSTLPAPLDDNATGVANPNWPESPEQRLARLRAKADANKDKTHQAVTDDDGNPLIAISSNKPGSDYFRSLDRVSSGDATRNSDAETRKKVAAAKERSKYSPVGAPRKYLTEPPVVYRSRSGTTPNDDLGLSPEDLAKRKAAEELQARELKGRRAS